MKNQLINNICAIFFIVFLISSCTDPKLKQQIMELQMSNDSLTTLLDSADNCCNPGDLPLGLMEIGKDTAWAALKRYETNKSSIKIRGTWLDHDINQYLYCTYKSNIYSGIGLNDSLCPMVVYAVQLIANNDTTYKFYALKNSFQSTWCIKDVFTGRSGTCPNRCP